MDPRKLHSSTQRKKMDTTGDPYLSMEMPYEMAVCKKCRAVYHNKRWYLDDELYKKTSKLKEVNKVLCPACLKIKDKFPGGIVRLKGLFLKEHREEIMNLIRNAEERAREINPLERIIGINEIKDGMEVTTTNERLAQRIGKSLQRAYQGEVEYKWTHDDKLVRVEWKR